MIELHEVLEGLLTEDEGVRLNVQALAPIIERALLATTMKTAVRLGCYAECSHLQDEDFIKECVTAGVAAMISNS